MDVVDGHFGRHINDDHHNNVVIIFCNGFSTDDPEEDDPSSGAPPPPQQPPRETSTADLAGPVIIEFHHWISFVDPILVLLLLQKRIGGGGLSKSRSVTTEIRSFVTHRTPTRLFTRWFFLTGTITDDL